MGWALDIVADEMGAELKAAGLLLNKKACVIVVGDTAIKLPLDYNTDKYRKLFRDYLKEAAAAKKAKQQAKQTTLLGDL